MKTKKSSNKSIVLSLVLVFLLISLPITLIFSSINTITAATSSSDDVNSNQIGSYDVSFTTPPAEVGYSDEDKGIIEYGNKRIEYEFIANDGFFWSGDNMQYTVSVRGSIDYTIINGLIMTCKVWDGTEDKSYTFPTFSFSSASYINAIYVSDWNQVKQFNITFKVYDEVIYTKNFHIRYDKIVLE